MISDRPLDTNLKEIREVKSLWPDRAVIVSAMVESDPKAWKDIIIQIEDETVRSIDDVKKALKRYEQAYKRVYINRAGRIYMLALK